MEPKFLFDGKLGSSVWVTRPPKPVNKLECTTERSVEADNRSPTPMRLRLLQATTTTDPQKICLGLRPDYEHNTDASSNIKGASA